MLSRSVICVPAVWKLAEQIGTIQKHNKSEEQIGEVGRIRPPICVGGGGGGGGLFMSSIIFLVDTSLPKMQCAPAFWYLAMTCAEAFPEHMQIRPLKCFEAKKQI